jgi:hypothetical protein
VGDELVARWFGQRTLRSDACWQGFEHCFEGAMRGHVALRVHPGRASRVNRAHRLVAADTSAD